LKHKQQANDGGSSVLSELELFLNDPSRELSSLHHHPLVKKNTNRGLPSSAPVEKFFSSRGLSGKSLILAEMATDENFELFLMLRSGIRHLGKLFLVIELNVVIQ